MVIFNSYVKLPEGTPENHDILGYPGIPFRRDKAIGSGKKLLPAMSLTFAQMSQVIMENHRKMVV